MSLSTENFSTVEDFLNNDAFRRWVQERRPNDQRHWREWLAQHPEKKDLYEQAVATFLVLQGKTVDLSSQQVKEKTDAILDQLPDSVTVIKPLPVRHWGRWAVAATVVGLLLLWLFNNPFFNQLPLLGFHKPQETTLPSRPGEWKIVKNQTGQSLVVLLPDNSSVLLSTGSQLRFRKQNQPATREVFLQGEGFFEVTKNPAKPFFVYTPNLTTRVLGTSFQVRSFDRESTAFVKVKTGRVSVIPVASPKQPILLRVNQQLRLDNKTEQIVKEERKPSIEQPTSPLAQQFVFTYTPIPEIFDRLEASYHMPIRYDRELLRNCTFTGELNDVPFSEKIRVICLAIDSTYEIVNNHLIIHSRGCN